MVSPPNAIALADLVRVGDRVPGLEARMVVMGVMALPLEKITDTRYWVAPSTGRDEMSIRLRVAWTNKPRACRSCQTGSSMLPESRL